MTQQDETPVVALAVVERRRAKKNVVATAAAVSMPQLLHIYILCASPRVAGVVLPLQAVVGQPASAATVVISGPCFSFAASPTSV